MFNRKSLAIYIYFSLLLGLMFVGGLALSNGSERRLVRPYDVPPPAAGKVVTDTGFNCPSPYSEPVIDLYFQSIYDRSDPKRASVDREAKKRYREQTRDMRRFENALLQMTNDYLRSGAKEFTYAECALDWLNTWAEADALLGKANFLGRVVRHWTLASLGSAYAQIREDEGLDAGKQKEIESWLFEVAHTVIDDYPEDGERMSQQNNLSYWAAWAVTITGVALNDRELYDWGIDRATYALENQLHGDGTFPHELHRGPKALQYHIFAAIPLVMIAETGVRNGDNLYEVRDGILHRLVKRILYGMDDPKYFNEKAGAEQESIKDLHSSHYTWMEAYNARFPRSDIQEHLKRIRPVFLRRTGGDMTWLYSSP